MGKYFEKVILQNMSVVHSKRSWPKKFRIFFQKFLNAAYLKVLRADPYTKSGEKIRKSGETPSYFRLVKALAHEALL